MQTPRSTLSDWLAHAEKLHPTSIDMGLDRVRAVAQRMKLKLDCTVITVAGTNGKGSTCAMLEAILLAAGYRCGLYTSPHLVHFEERCRVLGDIAQADDLVAHFQSVEDARAEQSLTYFEFTTLAILSLLAASKLDVVVLEVGLGGRLDAVNIIDADCAIITSVALDHMAILGADREAIGFEKAGILRAGRPAIISDPAPPDSVLAHAQAIGADVWRFGPDFSVESPAGQERQQWTWAASAAKGGRRYPGLAYPALRGANQLVNAAGVLAALESLRPLIPVTAQAIRQGLSVVELPGRFQMVPGQPALVLDVAHNPHAVAALAANLDAMGFFPCTHAVFGAMADKDIADLLPRINPLIDRWYFTDLPTPRAATAVQLHAQWQAQNTRHEVKASLHTSPQSALQAAALASEPADRIVVFGSFYTVGGVLADGVPRLFPGVHTSQSATAPNIPHTHASV